MTIEERLDDKGFEDVIYFTGVTYDSALLGVTDDNRAVYSFEKMVAWLVEHENISELDAIEWIEYNTLRALPCMGENASIIFYEICTPNGEKQKGL